MSEAPPIRLAQAAWPRWPLVTALAVLLVGPLLAPLLQASRLPLLADSGALARDLLAQYVCPTPARSYLLLGFPMAVCVRCWGATVGLWLGWLAFWGGPAPVVAPHGARRSGRLLALGWPWRLLLAALPFTLWVLEIAFWPAAPYPLLLINGAQAGFWAGLFFCSVWPGLRPPTASPR